ALMKRTLADQQQSSTQVAPPDPRPQTADEMAAWLQQALKLDRPASNIKGDRARPVAWTEKGGEAKPAMQPERWSFNLGGPNKVIQVEYWLGNKSASVRTTDNGLIATLTNFHKGVGMPLQWILLIDSLAGSLIFMALSGTIL